MCRSVATVFVVRAEDADASIVTQLQKLLGEADDGTNKKWDYFGHSVAISNGVAIVGAHGNDENGPESGTAFVFEMTSSNGTSVWTNVAKLNAADPLRKDRFGLAVAISNGIIVVSADREDQKAVNGGSVYLFEKVRGSWIQVAKLMADDGGRDDEFGKSVAISDGTIVVGANLDDDKGSDSGSAYVFEMSSPGDASSFTQVAKLTADDGEAGDAFGLTVAISDGTIVVGAHADDDKGSDSGSAYLFQKSSPSDASSWSQVAKLTADDGAASDAFGKSVAISDGSIFVGANGCDSFTGSVYLFEKSPSDTASWMQVAKLTSDDGEANDNFGHSVAISDSIVVVGAYKHADSTQRGTRGAGAGAAYLFMKNSSDDASSWAQVAKFTADDVSQIDWFGYSVAVSDGTVIVGSPQDDPQDLNSGSAYIFQVKIESPPPALPSPPPSQIVPDEKTITLFAGCSPLDKLTFDVENFKEQVGAMLIMKSLSNDFKYDKAVQMESSDCGTFTTNTIPAQGEEFGFYLYNLNNFTEYDAVSDIGCEGTDTEKCPSGDVWTALATCTNSVEGSGYTAHHRVFDGETFSYNWGTCDSACASPPATCQQDLEPVLGLSAPPHSSLFPMLPAPAVGVFAVAVASALAFVVVSKRRAAIVPGTVSTSSSKEARYGTIDV